MVSSGEWTWPSALGLEPVLPTLAGSAMGLSSFGVDLLVVAVGVSSVFAGGGGVAGLGEVLSQESDSDPAGRGAFGGRL